jgi:hypothetical protein
MNIPLPVKIGDHPWRQALCSICFSDGTVGLISCALGVKGFAVVKTDKQRGLRL